MVREWLIKWRRWRELNEAKQKHASHKQWQTLTRGKISIVVQCLHCGLEEQLWSRHWCNVVRLTEPHELLTKDSVMEVN